MKRMSLLLILNSFVCFIALSQTSNPSRLRVFIDCPNTFCDMPFIRTEINIVDFSHDNAAADVHVLITQQGTGGGGDHYQLIFFGQHQFKGVKDTMSFSTPPNTTELVKRDQLLKYIKTGLVPFIAKTSMASSMEINMKSADTLHASQTATQSIDPWKSWIFRLSADVNYNSDANYNQGNYRTNFSVNQVTEAKKIGIGFYFGKDRSTFEYEDNGTIQKFVVKNHNWSVNQYLVRTINSHWSWAYELRYSQNTFSNNKGRLFGRLAAEYNIFPFKDANNKLFTLSYGVIGKRNNYYDTTIFNKKKESLFGHRAMASLMMTQKWGNTNAGISYSNYFHDWKLFNLGVDLYINVRVTGGLSFYMFAFGGLTRDQLFLVKGNASPEEVLTRRRQLASGYNIYSSLGVSYQFGSKINNVVNPRFDRSGGSGDD